MNGLNLAHGKNFCGPYARFILLLPLLPLYPSMVLLNYAKAILYLNSFTDPPSQAFSPRFPSPPLPLLLPLLTDPACLQRSRATLARSTRSKTLSLPVIIPTSTMVSGFSGLIFSSSSDFLCVMDPYTTSYHRTYRRRGHGCSLCGPQPRPNPFGRHRGGFTLSRGPVRRRQHR